MRQRKDLRGRRRDRITPRKKEYEYATDDVKIRPLWTFSGPTFHLLSFIQGNKDLSLYKKSQQVNQLNTNTE